MKIVPPGLAVLGTVLSDIRIRNAPVILFRDRWVDPNSIFCRGHEGYGVLRTCPALIQHMDVWSHVIDLCGPQRMKKKDRVEAEKQKPPGVRQSGRSGETSIFPLTKLIMDVPNSYSGICRGRYRYSQCKKSAVSIYTSKSTNNK